MDLMVATQFGPIFDVFCIFQFCIHPRSVPHVFHVRIMHPRFASTRRCASPQTLATSGRATLSLVPAPLFHASSNGRMGVAHSPRLAPRRLLLVPSGSLNCEARSHCCSLGICFCAHTTVPTCIRLLHPPALLHPPFLRLDNSEFVAYKTCIHYLHPHAILHPCLHRLYRSLRAVVHPPSTMRIHLLQKPRSRNGFICGWVDKNRPAKNKLVLTKPKSYSVTENRDRIMAGTTRNCGEKTYRYSSISKLWALYKNDDLPSVEDEEEEDEQDEEEEDADDENDDDVALFADGTVGDAAAGDNDDELVDDPDDDVPLAQSLSKPKKDTDDKGRDKGKAIKNPEKAKGKGPKVRIQLAGTAKSITTKPTRSEQRAQSQGNVEKMAGTSHAHETYNTFRTCIRVLHPHAILHPRLYHCARNVHDVHPPNASTRRFASTCTCFHSAVPRQDRKLPHLCQCARIRCVA